MFRTRVCALAAAAIVLSAHTAAAQTWPSRPVTMMVPLPAGGTADLMAREVAQALSEEYGQPFVVENRPGASGNLAAAAVTRAAPDGATLLFASQAQAAFNKLMFKSLSYDPARDLVPIVLVMKSPVALIAGMNAPVTSFQGLVDYAKANPGKLTVGHAGVGSMAHIAFELLQARTGIILSGALQGWRAGGYRSARGSPAARVRSAFQFYPAGAGEEGPHPGCRHRAASERIA
jgi:tripartite-type tricarboxylate transporter receptor subunit TctC